MAIKYRVLSCMWLAYDWDFFYKLKVINRNGKSSLLLKHITRERHLPIFSPVTNDCIKVLHVLFHVCFWLILNHSVILLRTLYLQLMCSHFVFTKQYVSMHYWCWQCLYIVVMSRQLFDYCSLSAVQSGAYCLCKGWCKKLRHWSLTVGNLSKHMLLYYFTKCWLLFKLLQPWVGWSFVLRSWHVRKFHSCRKFLSEKTVYV